MREQVEVQSVTVAGNSSANIEVISEKGPFLLRTVVVTEGAEDFLVTDIKVGKNSQLVNCAAVPAAFFVETPRQEGLAYDVLQRGMKLTISVTNTCSEAREFKATLFGDLVFEHAMMDLVRGDRFLMGLGHTIQRLGKATLNVRSQLPMTPVLFFVPLSVKDDVRVLDVRVAGESVASRELLSKGEATVSLTPKAMQCGDWLCVDIESDYAVAKGFTGAVVGLLRAVN